MPHNAAFTLAGRSLLVSRLRGLATPAEPSWVLWGIGTATGAANSDVGLFNAIPGFSLVAGTSTGVQTSMLADTYQVTAALTADATRTITEVGLFSAGGVANAATIAASIAAGNTAVTLAATIGPTTGNFLAQINNECVLVTGGQGTSIWTISRGQLGSVAAIQPSGTRAMIGGDGGAHVNFSVGPATAPRNNGANMDMFVHADFAAMVLNSGDSILFTIGDQFTGA